MLNALGVILVAIALQQGQGLPAPLPQRTEEWTAWAVRVLIPLGTAVYLVWQWLLKPIRKEIAEVDDRAEKRVGLEKGTTVKATLDGMGRNISSLDGECRESRTRIEQAERRIAGVETEHTRMSEEVSEQRGLVTGLIKGLADSKQEIINAVNDARREAAAADRQTGERLARLEANVEVARSLEEGFDRIARIMEGQVKRGER